MLGETSPEATPHCWSSIETMAGTMAAFAASCVGASPMKKVAARWSVTA